MEMRDPGMMSVVVFICMSVIAFMLLILVTIYTFMQKAQNQKPLFRQRQMGYMIAGSICIIAGFVGAVLVREIKDPDLLHRFDNYLSGLVFVAAFVFYFLTGFIWKKLLKD